MKKTMTNVLIGFALVGAMMVFGTVEASADLCLVPCGGGK